MVNKREEGAGMRCQVRASVQAKVVYFLSHVFWGLVRSRVTTGKVTKYVVVLHSSRAEVRSATFWSSALALDPAQKLPMNKTRKQTPST